MSQAKRIKNDWVEKYGNEIRIPSNIYAFFCVICDKAVSCEHMGESDVTRHTQKFKVRRAEVKFSMFIAEHHIPIAVMDHLVAQCFPDSKIASFASRRTKTCIINDAVAPSLKIKTILFISGWFE